MLHVEGVATAGVVDAVARIVGLQPGTDGVTISGNDKTAASTFMQGGGVYAECGGMLYLFETLTDKRGRQAELVGLLPGEALMQARLCGLGMQSLGLPAGELRGHTFHHSRLETALEPWKRGRRQNGRGDGECVYRKGSVTASYLHLYFPMNPAAAAGFLI